MNMRIGILPLDSRPCTGIFPQTLATFAKVECLAPPPELMDYFLQSADCEGLIKWLIEIAPTCDALVIACEMLAYGGFIAARAHRCDTETSLKRVKALEQIKADNPTLSIHVASIILRPTITVESKDQITIYQKLYQYSKATYLADKTNSPEYIEEKARVVSEIPKNILEEFLAVRKRNAIVNKETVKLMATGVLDSLLLLQEDSEPYGIQRKEQEELAELIKENNLQDKIVLQNGGDEGGCLLIAKAFMGKRPTPLRVEVKFSNEANKNFVAMYEDRPFSDNLKSSLDFLNLVNTADALDVLYIHNPKTAQKDASTSTDSEYTKEETVVFAAEILKDIDQGRRVYLLDLLYSNGGDGDILHAIGNKTCKLWGYSGWNTTCNSLGTILAQLVFSQLTGSSNDMFTTERILDDYVYQTVVRRKLSSAIQEIGQDPWNIANLEWANEKLNELMQSEKCLDNVFNKTPNFVATLPWNRTFEAEIIVI